MLYIFAFVACSSGKANNIETSDIVDEIKTERKKRFSGNYNREFNDLQDLHMEAS